MRHLTSLTYQKSDAVDALVHIRQLCVYRTRYAVVVVVSSRCCTCCIRIEFYMATCIDPAGDLLLRVHTIDFYSVRPVEVLRRAAKLLLLFATFSMTARAAQASAGIDSFWRPALWVRRCCGIVEFLGWCIMGLVSKVQNDWCDVGGLKLQRHLSVSSPLLCQRFRIDH